MILIQFSSFSAIDGFLLEWLPLVVGIFLTIWLFAELKNAPPVSEIEELIEPPKPLPAKEMGKPSRQKKSMASLIAKEFEKRS